MNEINKESSMNPRELEALIKDENVSDEEVYAAIKEFTADKFDGGGNIVPPGPEKMEQVELLGILTRKLRPQVVERMRQEFLKHPCCGCE